MTRLFGHSITKSPTLSADRDEEPRAACADRLDLVDAMHDHAADTKGYRAARAGLAVLCLDCPLRFTCEERAA